MNQEITFIYKETDEVGCKHYLTADERFSVIERADSSFFSLYKLNVEDDCYDWTETHHTSMDECVKEATTIWNRKLGTHASHCCVLHGCKYGDADCPVVKQEVEQRYICERCTYEGIQTFDDIKEYQEVQQTLKTAKENGTKEITVSVDFLDRILNYEPDFY